MGKWVPLFKRRGALICCLAVFVLGLLTYSYALTLPYQLDDFVHFRTLFEHALVDVWASTAGLGYYRPVPSTLWKLVYWLSGGYPPVVIHAINVVCHALNGLFVFMLLALHQLGTRGGRIFGVTAAVLFLLFPFSYQAVPWATSLTHPLVITVSLGAILLAVQAHERGSRPMQFASLGLTLLAPFTHETGVMVALLLTLFYLTTRQTRSLKDIALRTWAWWACSLLAAGVLLVVRTHAALPSGTTDLESRWQNAVYFLQGIAYPVAPLATRLMGLVRGLNDLASILIVCVPSLVLLTLLYLRLGQGRLAFFALGWYLVMIAPAWLTLAFSYVVDGPRLMYEASAGAAIFWALPLAIALERSRAGHRTPVRYAGVVLVLLVTIGIVAGSVGYLNERADMYEQTRYASEGLLSGALQEGTLPQTNGKRFMISVNFPAWIAPKTPTYALGHDGVSYIPDYSSPMDLVWTMTGQDRRIANVVVTELQSIWRFNYRNYGQVWSAPDLQPQLRNAPHIFFTSDRYTDLATYDVGNLEFVNKPPASQYVASYNRQLALLSGEWRKDVSTLQVTLHWQSWLTLTQEVHTYVHLQDEAGNLVAQEDGLPLMGVANPLWWRPGDQWRDMRVVLLPVVVKPGKYVLRVGVYPTSGGARFEALDASGRRFDNDSATLATLELP